MAEPTTHHDAKRTASAPILHLASRSPRRRQLLSERGVAHEAAPSPVDDSRLTPGDVRPRQWVAALAYLKAAAAARRLLEQRLDDRLVLGADTVVVKQGAIIGQPRDEEDAARIIRLLRAGSHEVVSGVTLLDLRSGTRRIFVDAAAVTVGDISDDVIDEYLAGGSWRGKAGAYNLSERLEAGWPISFRGDPATIMGLPVERLMPLLERSGVESNPSGDSPHP